MAAEGQTSQGQTAGEYIVHHLHHLQTSKQSAVVDFSVVNMDSVFYSILLGVLGAMALGSDGSLGQAGALLFLCFIGAMCALSGSLCVMGMSRILKWKPAQRS